MSGRFGGASRGAVVLGCDRSGSPAVIPRDQRHHLDFVRMKPPQVAVLDQVIRMLVMARVADVAADVVHQRCVLEPFALAIRERMNRAGLIEEREREPHDLIGVVCVIVAALGKLQRAPAPYVRDAVDLCDLAAVSPNVVEDRALREARGRRASVPLRRDGEESYRAEQLRRRPGPHVAGRAPGMASRCSRSSSVTSFRTLRICLTATCRLRSSDGGPHARRSPRPRRC